MAKITCPHCKEVIELAKTPPGRYQCPFCKKLFNIAHKGKSDEIVIPRKKVKQNPDFKELDFNVKVTTPFGIGFVSWGGYLAITGDELDLAIGVILVLFGLLCLTPLMFYNQDKRNKELESKLNSMNDSDEKIRIENTTKSTVRKVLVTSIGIGMIITIIGMIIVGIATLIFVFFLLSALSGGGGSAFG